VPQRAEAAAPGIVHVEGRRHLGKRAVALVAKEQIARGLVGRGVEGVGHRAAVLLARPSAVRVGRFVLHVTADVEIEVAVAIVVAPRRTGPVALGIGKRPDAPQPTRLVAEQQQLPVGRDDQVLPAVAVVVAPGRAHADDADLGLVRIGPERPVAQVFVEQRGSPLSGVGVERAPGGNDEQILVAVVVVVPPRRAGAHVLGQLGRARAVEVHESVEAGRIGDVGQRRLRRVGG